MANYEQYYKMSIEALTQWITENKEIPTEKIWNHLAGTEGYLTSQSLEFISQMKFVELCKNIYRDMKKQNKKEKNK